MNGLSSWADLDHDLESQARVLGMGSPTDAWLGAALDDLARGRFPEIPTEAEALAWAEERER